LLQECEDAVQGCSSLLDGSIEKTGLRWDRIRNRHAKRPSSRDRTRGHAVSIEKEQKVIRLRNCLVGGYFRENKLSGGLFGRSCGDGLLGVRSLGGFVTGEIEIGVQRIENDHGKFGAEAVELIFGP
jgi:hypothetical protein